MEIVKFIELIKSGFDIDFNVGDIFYSVSSEDQENSSTVYLGNELKKSVIFKNIEELLEYKIDGKSLKDIIENTPEEEIFY